MRVNLFTEENEERDQQLIQSQNDPGKQSQDQTENRGNLTVRSQTTIHKLTLSQIFKHSKKGELLCITHMNILYIILKHVIWRFQIYNLFREIFKFREDKSNNVFREIRKCFRKTAKFEFFAKQIIYLESPDHPLQNDI